MNQITKRIFIYILGTFLLGIGVTFSIKADLGVSPVSSLGYAIALITSISVGTAVFLSNLVFIAVQFLLSGKFEAKNYLLQLISSVLVSVFIDATLALGIFLPDATNWTLKIVYLVISLFIIALGVFLYVSARLPLASYDALIPIVGEKLKKPFGKAKTISDLVNITISTLICLLFIQTFGSIGIGTLIAAYFTGKIVGVIIKYFKAPLYNWLGFSL
ncbi:MAG: DUF6198 family protein [Solibacillus isronensis]